jgi:hypothetical protein
MTVKTGVFQMRVDDDFTQKLTALCNAEPEDVSKADMIRLLVERAHAELPKGLYARIIGVLTPEEPSMPFVPGEVLFNILNDEFPSPEHDGGDDPIRRLVRALVKRGIVEEGWHPHNGEQYALGSALQHPDYLAEQDAYSTLKEGVLERARMLGLQARWHPSRSWILTRPDGEVYAEGTMHQLDAALDAEHDKSRKSKKVKGDPLLGAWRKRQS